MRKCIILFIYISLFSLHAQVTVSTISGEIKGSGGISLDESGNLIIADFGDFLSITDPDGQPNNILIMDTNNNINTYATGFIGASGNDFDSNGVLFQSDIRDNAIFKIVGGVRTFVTNSGISAPVGLAFDSNDDFYVCNCGGNTIQKVSGGGSVSTLFASGILFSCPNGITVDEDDNLYVSNFNNGNIIKIAPGGQASVIANTPPGSTGGASNGHLDYHEPTRTLFIASHGSNRIFALRIDDPFNLIPIAGSGVRGNADGSGDNASFSRPNGVAVTPDGDSIYINSAVPVTNVPNGPLNPQLIRLITGVQSIMRIDDFESNNTVRLYPNPVADSFQIELLYDMTDGDLYIAIFSLDGSLVFEDDKISVTSNRLNKDIDISNLRSGFYFYKVKDGSRTLHIGKLIKE